MLVPLLIALAQPASGTPIDPATMSPAQRTAANAIGSWMNCLFPRVADTTFPNHAAADAAVDAALLACRSEEAAVRSAFAAGISRRRADALVADLRGQFRTGARQGAIRRTTAAQ